MELGSVLETMKKCMECLTGEPEEYWRNSQAYHEAPYNFLLTKIKEVEEEIYHKKQGN